MTVILTGGGSGGHITPLMAVAAELKRQAPDTRIVYIGQKGDSLADIPSKDENIDEVRLVRAGKFRRYHGEGWKQLLDIPTLLKNIRDFFFVLIGTWQSWRILGEIQPSVMFSRGGFVSVPVGLGSALRHVPFITHDSDPIPSLANRLIARWAAVHAVALPKEVYDYPQDKTVTTGVPLSDNFVPVTPDLKQEYRQQIDIPKNARLLFIIGGGLGAQRVNQAVGEALPHLLHEFNDLYVVHSAGRANQEAIEQFYNKNLTPGEQGRVRVFGYLEDVYRYSGAADIVICRAGATNLAEFAVQGKACIVLPSAVLVGGHQLKNAQYLADHDAALILTEADLTDDPNRLAKQASHLLHDYDHQKALAKHISAMAQPGATKAIADLILDQTKGSGR